MFGISFVKVRPTTHLIEYKNGKIAREGAGLSFFYCTPTTSLVAVPIGSRDGPFMFEAQTADFQAVTVQGQVTYRIADPRKAVQMLNFALRPDGRKTAPRADTIRLTATPAGPGTPDLVATMSGLLGQLADRVAGMVGKK